ncbi:MFS transporter [Streptacidiphilus jiangxiensis]|uniref:Major facilitator superfamily (MFS) profile domain-containing protein n=1 Tax=Streptacidiphilus jiangxiensis TaxID=235985 RepID=A0A1H7V204_STRJI|nr:MFS transporter [Streptacidiphilus jiangxiensis]SEM03174.1 hypothetical protein SAMN05414137_11722 [Streptacidiphilus jiangxiensis]
MSVMEKCRSAVELTGGRVLTWSLLGRLPAAMAPIGTLLMASQQTGSVWRGSAVTGALALGQAVGGPVAGRSADRHGQRRVGLPLAVVNAVALLALVAASHWSSPLGWQLLPAALAGLSTPAVGPLARSRWLHLAAGRSGPASAALWLDGLIDELTFTTGPALVGLLAALVAPAAAMLLAAALVGSCGTLFALHPSAPPGSDARRAPAPSTVAGASVDRSDRREDRLLAAPYALLLATMALLGVAFGSIQVGVTSTTEQLGRPGAAGLIYALMGGASACAGVAVAALPARFGLPARLRAGTVLLLVAALLLPLLCGTLAGLALAVGCVGLAVAPQMITVFGLVERTVPESRLGEAMAGLVSGITLAQSLGTAVAGWAAAAAGPSAPFAVTCAAALAALLLALSTATERRYLSRSALPVPA